MTPVMIDALCYSWPIVDQLETEIIAAEYDADRFKIQFASSLFFPGGGGQSCDRGTVILNNVSYPVISVCTAGDGIWHYISSLTDTAEKSETGLSASAVPGVTAILILDRNIRMHNAICHTAQHLLSSVLLHLFNIPTVSIHLGDSGNTIDVDTQNFDSEMACSAEEALINIIEEDLPVSVHLCPPENPLLFPLRKKIPETEGVIRIIDIGGLDFSPCCGTHLPSTGRIGLVRIIGWEKYKGLMRIRFAAGHDAWILDTSIRDILMESAASAEINPADLPLKISAMNEKIFRLESDLKHIQDIWIDEEGKKLLEQFSKLRIINVKYSGLSFGLIRRALTEWRKKTEKIILVADMSLLKLICVSSAQKNNHLNLEEVLSAVFALCGAKGGGGALLMQAAFSSQQALEQCFELCIKKLESCE